MATSYYRPYLPSDSETSDADTRSTPPSSPRPKNAGEDIQVPDFSAFALALSKPSAAAGPTVATVKQNDAYALNKVGDAEYGMYPIITASGEAIKVNTTSLPSVISLESI